MPRRIEQGGESNKGVVIQSLNKSRPLLGWAAYLDGAIPVGGCPRRRPWQHPATPVPAHGEPKCSVAGKSLHMLP